MNRKTFAASIAAALALYAVVGNASAIDAAAPNKKITENVSSVLKGAPIEQISLNKKTGLYEVVTPNGIAYTDSEGSFMIFGTLVDTKSGANLTEQRLDDLSKFSFADLPLKDAIKTVRGNGSRVMVTFEDPNCGYCKKLMQEMNKIDNVTVYTFLIPILSADSASKSKAIWCSPDRSKTWIDFMSKGTAFSLPAAGTCDAPLDRNLTLKQKLRIGGTPAIYFSDNSKIKGYVSAEQLETRLK